MEAEEQYPEQQMLYPTMEKDDNFASKFIEVDRTLELLYHDFLGEIQQPDGQWRSFPNLKRMNATGANYCIRRLRAVISSNHSTSYYKADEIDKRTIDFVDSIILHLMEHYDDYDMKISDLSGIRHDLEINFKSILNKALLGGDRDSLFKGVQRVEQVSEVKRDNAGFNIFPFKGK